MGRAPCCEKVGLNRGRWTPQEDETLKKYIQEHGEGSWRSLPKNAGLLRCGKSCRLRWINYLRSDLKRGNFTAEEEDVIVRLHHSLGNRWSLIAEQLPGRTDNEIKNYWNTHLSRRIYTFMRPAAAEDITVKLALTKTDMAGWRKRKKNKNAATVTSKVRGRDACEPKDLSRSSISGQVDDRHNMVLDPSLVQEGGQGNVVNGPYQDSGVGILGPREGRNGVNKGLCSYEEREKEMLVPHARLPCSISASKNIQVMQSSCVLTPSENRENEIMGFLEEKGNGTSEEGDSGVFSYNGDCGELYSSTSMTSCFGSEWNDMIWEDMVNGLVIWQDGEDILSWM